MGHGSWTGQLLMAHRSHPITTAAGGSSFCGLSAAPADVGAAIHSQRVPPMRGRRVATINASRARQVSLAEIPRATEGCSGRGLEAR